MHIIISKVFFYEKYRSSVNGTLVYNLGKKVVTSNIRILIEQKTLRFIMYFFGFGAKNSIGFSIIFKKKQEVSKTQVFVLMIYYYIQIERA